MNVVWRQHTSPFRNGFYKPLFYKRAKRYNYQFDTHKCWFKIQLKYMMYLKISCHYSSFIKTFHPLKSNMSFPQPIILQNLGIAASPSTGWNQNWFIIFLVAKKCFYCFATPLPVWVFQKCQNTEKNSIFACYYFQ